MTLLDVLVLSLTVACMAGPRLLERADVVAADSEFSIAFPEEKHAGSVTTIMARSNGSKGEGVAYSSHKELMKGGLAGNDYRGLIDMMQQLDESALETKIPEGCREPYTLRIRVGKEHQTYVGCRDATSNATIVSRIYKRLEFLLIKDAGHR